VGNNRGFTLLEVLVASLVMAIAVAGLLANLSTSLRNGARLTDSDRASSLARAKMDELILQVKLPHNAEVGGTFPPAQTGWPDSGWRANVTPFEMPPEAQVGTPILERIRLEIWWNTNGVRRAFPLEAYRVGRMVAGDVVQR
jgi:general secretion pathway protein I